MLAFLQSGTRPREQRQKVMIAARMRSGANWVDVGIHNVSSRGLLVAADAPPEPGAYVDIRRGSRIIIGRVVWKKARFFGVRSQDRIDINALINEPRRGLAAPGAKNDPAQIDRRNGPRMTSDAANARRLERSRQISSALEYGLIVVAGCFVAGVIAIQLYEVMSRPFAAAAAKLVP